MRGILGMSGHNSTSWGCEMAKKLRRKSQIEHHPLGADLAADLAVQYAIRETKSEHHSLPLAIALQFYDGDQDEATELARFMADLEPKYRDDVMLILASRFDGQVNPGIRKTLAYCAKKFPCTYMRSDRQAKGYLEGSFGTWIGIAEKCYLRYSTGLWPYHSVFFCEADGVPLRWDWIDEIKKSHEDSLTHGKRVTGAKMYEHGFGHVQGSMVMHLSCVPDCPSLKVCPPEKAWDMYHAQVLMSECGDRSPIANQYGTRKMSEQMYVAMSKEFAWLPVVKDGSAMECARKIWINGTKKKGGSR